MPSPSQAYLLPRPRVFEPREGSLALPREVSLAGGSLAPQRAGTRLEGALARSGAGLTEPGSGTALLRLERRPGLGEEAYELEIHPDHVALAAAAQPGFHHALGTLAQLLENASSPTEPLLLSCLRIEDRPGFRVRGAMLDISRNRVPTMESLFALVEKLSRWKFNQLQLYTEHTFAYAGHEEVWRDWSPMTPEEIRELDRFCAEHFIELVPNQQSFGHMHHWLKHERYNDLAEVPEGVEHPFHFTPEPFSLNPRDGRVFDLLEDLYDQLLPCFSSSDFNVGLDETFDLGQGRSAEAVQEKGVDGVYLEFLVQVARRVEERGKRMHFWADILLNHPERVGELPEGVVPNLWGYEAHHPFARECAHVSSFELDFVVCPGTSSWQTIGGRLANMRGNIASAVQHARANGALGLFVTDWGDRGHLQPMPVSDAGWLTFGAAAWNPEAPELTEPELELLLSQHVHDDPTGAMGRAWVELARAGEACGLEIHNASPLSIALTRAPEVFPCEELVGLTREGLDRAEDVLSRAASERSSHRARAPRTELVAAEHAWCERTLRLALDLARERLAAPGALVRVDPGTRGRWKAEIDALLEELGGLWTARSRPGGLASSTRWLSRIRASL